MSHVSSFATRVLGSTHGSWERRAQLNVGVTVDIHLTDRLARGEVELLSDECGKRTRVL